MKIPGKKIISTSVFVLLALCGACFFAPAPKAAATPGTAGPPISKKFWMGSYYAYNYDWTSFDPNWVVPNNFYYDQIKGPISNYCPIRSVLVPSDSELSDSTGNELTPTGNQTYTSGEQKVDLDIYAGAYVCPIDPVYNPTETDGSIKGVTVDVTVRGAPYDSYYLPSASAYDSDAGGNGSHWIHLTTGGHSENSIPLNLGSNQICYTLTGDYISAPPNYYGDLTVCKTINYVPITPNFACSAGVMPDATEPYSPFDITAAAAYKTRKPDTMDITNITVTPVPSVAGVVTDPEKITGSSTSGNISQTVHYTTGTPDVGTYNVSWTATASIPSIGWSQTLNCSSQFIVAYKPYLHVYGGDVEVGTNGMGVLPLCDPSSTTEKLDTSHNVIGWNTDLGGLEYGAGSQFATYAVGVLKGSTTGNGQQAGAKLAFSNTGAGAPSTDLFGGNFTSLSAADIAASKNCGTFVPSTVNMSDPSIPTSKTLPDPADPNQAMPLNSTKPIPTIYVHGNVYINSDITMQGNFDDTDTYASYRVVAYGGNIYIGANVRNLSGLYVAQPDTSGVGGVIYTCATAPDTSAPYDANFYDTCHNSLTIRGSFVAEHVEFMRTAADADPSSVVYCNAYSGGTSSSCYEHGAENFVYSPDQWIANPDEAPLPTKDDTYDSIINLPPVL